MTKILVIDDSGIMRKTVDFVLKHNGYTILEASDGASGIALARREKPDLILLDLMMPYLSGEAVALTMQRDPDLRSTPIIVITAMSQSDVVISMLESNVKGYLLKPVEPTVLRNRVESVLADTTAT